MTHRCPDIPFRVEQYLSISAVVYYLRATPWQVVGFSVEKYMDKLFATHRHIETSGSLVMHNHRLLTRAVRPE